MGNANFAQPPKIHKDRKEGDADTDKGRQPANGSGKAASQSSQGQKDGHKVGSRATNPFIIFFLRLRSKKPNEHVTVIARAAGKLWSRMTPEQRKKYVDLANEEKKRRQERKRKRKRSSTHSRVILRSALSITAIDVCLFVFANRSDFSTIIFGGSVEYLDRKRGLSRMDQCDEKTRTSLVRGQSW
ncbi:hypothetical protein ALC57_13452 [Trachymyrmex cornetzi]|uniref:HMG box domain-containing protein n=1 Tax=Trachymyrmex cornetzi TaxID=471704 RepID=A0A195DN03_9HYME|nr:hypothetical protein ALC57_13452 [Trachymyrmex cornetzi]